MPTVPSMVLVSPGHSMPSMPSMVLVSPESLHSLHCLHGD